MRQLTDIWRSLELLVQAATGPYLYYALAAPLLLAAGVFFNSKLRSLNVRWLEWSPFHVRSNIALVPLRYRLIWAPYALLLAMVMPFLALIEEAVFRAGTTNWVRGLLWGTIAFGLLHLFSFVSLRMTIYLALVGALFVELYMVAGLAAVFVLHATYNLTALAMTVATRNRGTLAT